MHTLLHVASRECIRVLSEEMLHQAATVTSLLTRLAAVLPFFSTAWCILKPAQLVFTSLSELAWLTGRGAGQWCI